MGSWVSSRSSDDQSRVNKEFITDLNKVMVCISPEFCLKGINILLNVLLHCHQIERQLHSNNQMRERMMAMQVARARELLNWVTVFYVISMTGLVFGYRRTRKPGYLFPLVPFSMVIGYQADLAYGTKLHRIRAEAEHIMQFEMDMLNLPCGLPTVSNLDLARQVEEERKKLHPNLPPL